MACSAEFSQEVHQIVRHLLVNGALIDRTQRVAHLLFARDGRFDIGFPGCRLARRPPFKLGLIVAGTQLFPLRGPVFAPGSTNGDGARPVYGSPASSAMKQKSVWDVPADTKKFPGPFGVGAFADKLHRRRVPPTGQPS